MRSAVFVMRLCDLSEDRRCEPMSTDVRIRPKNAGLGLREMSEELRIGVDLKKKGARARGGKGTKRQETARTSSVGCGRACGMFAPIPGDAAA